MENKIKELENAIFMIEMQDFISQEDRKIIGDLKNEIIVLKNKGNYERKNSESDDRKYQDEENNQKNS